MRLHEQLLNDRCRHDRPRYEIQPARPYFSSAGLQRENRFCRGAVREEQTVRSAPSPFSRSCSAAPVRRQNDRPDVALGPTYRPMPPYTEFVTFFAFFIGPLDTNRWTCALYGNFCLVCSAADSFSARYGTSSGLLAFVSVVGIPWGRACFLSSAICLSFSFRQGGHRPP